MDITNDFQTETKEMTSYILFGMNGESFAVEVKKVLEILEVPGITKIPSTPKYMAGVINLRGRALPVIDTRIKFGLERTTFTIDTCVVVMEVSIDGKVAHFGAIVDEVLEVIDIAAEEIGAFKGIQAKFRLDFIKGMIQQNEKFIMLLDIDKVFSSGDVDEMKNLEKVSSEPQPISA